MVAEATEKITVPRNGGSRPVPDPTVLTTEQLDRTVGYERKVFEAQLDSLRAIAKTLQIQLDTRPVEISEAIGHLRDVFTGEIKRIESTSASEIRRIDNLFIERDASRANTESIQKVLRDADARRENELAATVVRYETIIEDMRRISLDTTSTLLATQLREVKNDLSDRTAKLEQFRWESGGKTSISDPAIANLMTELSASVAGLKKAWDTSEGRTAGGREVSTDMRQEKRDNTGLIFGMIGAVVGIIVIAGGFVAIVSAISKSPTVIERVVPPASIALMDDRPASREGVRAHDG